MPVLNRSALEASPLADLHTIASEVGLDGYRRLRKAELIAAILGEEVPAPDPAPAAVTQDQDDADGATPAGEDGDEAPARSRSRRSRGGRGRSRVRDEDAGDDTGDATTDEPATASDGDDAPRAPRSRSRRGGREAREDAPDERDADAPETTVSGVVELLGNGSGFLRVSPPDPSDGDVYVSAAQVRRCELVSGDTVAGPVRPPRRSERYPSLVRVDTINGSPADEVAEGTPWDDLTAAFPSERLALASEDPTLKAIEWLTPIGRGSRVTIVGAARAGKTEALRRLAGALATQEGLELTLVNVGIRPEELRDAPEGLTPVAALGLTASADAQGQAVERAIDSARRVAARGGHAVVLIDSLDGLPPAAARKALGAARAIVDGGTLTVIATSTLPVGGETTVIALDVTLTSTGRLPSLDLVNSGTLRPELLVGDAGADAIAQARAGALGA